MSFKKLIGMVIVLVLLVSIAMMQRKEREVQQAKSTDETLLAGVDLNTIDRIEVRKGAVSTVIAKKDGHWVVESLYDYPVDFGKLAKSLRDLSEVKLGSAVRATNVNDDEFGLNETAKVITLKAGDRTVGEIAVGARREASSGWAGQFFIRQADNDNVYLVNYEFRSFSENAVDWINRELLRVQPNSIVSIKTGDVEMKEEEGKWELVGLNPETEELNTTAANQLRSGLQYLNSMTIADPAANTGMDKAEEFVAKTDDGFTYTVKVGGTTDEGRYAKIDVAYTRPQPPSKPEGDDKEKQAAYEQALKTYNETVDANEKKAEDLMKKFSAWTYVIGSYNADQLLVPRKKLVKVKGSDEVPPMPTPVLPQK